MTKAQIGKKMARQLHVKDIVLLQRIFKLVCVMQPKSKSSSFLGLFGKDRKVILSDSPSVGANASQLTWFVNSSYLRKHLDEDEETDVVMSILAGITGDSDQPINFEEFLVFMGEWNAVRLHRSSLKEFPVEYLNRHLSLWKIFKSLPLSTQFDWTLRVIYPIAYLVLLLYFNYYLFATNAHSFQGMHQASNFKD